MASNAAIRARVRDQRRGVGAAVSKAGAPLKSRGPQGLRGRTGAKAGGVKDYTPRPAGGLRATKVGVGAPLKRAQPRQGGNPLNDAVKIGRTLGHTVGAIGETVAKHPADSTYKTLKTGGEIVKGVAGAAIGLPVYAVTDTVKSVTGQDRGDKPLDIAKRMIDQEGKRISKTYGPSFRGEKGAYKKLKKTVAKEGPLLPALDVATVVAPASVGLGKAAKLGDRARPALKVNPVKPGVPQKARPSAVGAATDAATDAARAVAQRTAKARADKRLRTRVPGVKAKHIEGRKPSVLNTEPKPLTARRALLKPGEQAPVTKARPNRSLRLSTATDVGRGETLGARRVARIVNDPKKGSGSLRESFRGLPEELHHAALTATQLGIRNAAGARAVLPARIAEIERSRAAAAAGKLGDTPARRGKAKSAEAHGGADELVKLREYLANPRVFERPEVLKAAEVAAARNVGAREGLGAQRAAAGRSKLVGETLGVVPAKKLHKAEATRVAAARASMTVRAGDDAKRLGGEVAKAKTAVEAARRTLESTKGRVSALEDAFGGKGAAGGHGLAQARAAVAAAQSDLRAARAVATDVKRSWKDARKTASAPLKRPKESAVQYEARVAEEAGKRGLAPPEYVPSKFERDDLRVVSPHSSGANPLARERSGVLYKLGREDKSYDVVAGALTANLRRGAKLEAESTVLGKNGLRFANEKAATEFLRGLGIDGRDAMLRAGLDMHKPGIAARSTGANAPVGKRGLPKAKTDAGDYVKTDNVFVLPSAVKSELDALGVHASTPPSIMSKLASYPQAALLALSPSWWQFQRVNDTIAAAIGGSLQHTVALEKQRKALSGDERDLVAALAGGSLSKEMLTPHSVQKLGRYQRILDENPRYRDALRSDKPATALLARASANLPTALLRSDQAITGGVRERQLLHNLNVIARKMDPDVKAVAGAFGPLGHAFKTADTELARKLLNDPAYKAKLEEGAQRLYKIHGDWHNYTARERSFKNYAAFYGFLRYATRMALYTLPINHPHVGLLIGQLGSMGAEDAKAIIGPDMPYGLGALYNKDGTVAADFTRANPLMGPLFSVTKPEQALALGTPLAGISLSWLVGQPIGLSDSSEGYVKQYTVKGDPKNHAVGGFTGEGRLRIGADQLLSLLAPYREWKRYDGRQQSSDSLAFDRRILRAPESPSVQLKINAKNEAAAGGMSGLVHNVAPLLSPGSNKNLKVQGEQISAAKHAGAQRKQLQQAKRDYALNNTTGQIRAQAAVIRARADADRAAARSGTAEIRHQAALLRARLGR